MISTVFLFIHRRVSKVGAAIPKWTVPGILKPLREDVRASELAV
jgi:hypothetical protein